MHDSTARHQFSGHQLLARNEKWSHKNDEKSGTSGLKYELAFKWMTEKMRYCCTQLKMNKLKRNKK